MGNTRKKKKRRRSRRTRPGNPLEKSSDTQQAKPAPTLQLERWRQFYLNKQYDHLSESLLGILGHFNLVTYARLTENTMNFIETFVRSLLYFFTRPDYVISRRFARDFITLQPEVANLTALTSLQTTDSALQAVSKQPNNFIKILTLWSSRNTVKIDRKALFDADAHLASLWYAVYYRGVESLATETVYRNMREHLDYVDDRYMLFNLNVTAPYFPSTYIDFENERPIKQKIHRLIRQKYRKLTIHNRPDDKSIAVITGKWFPTSAVCRSSYPLVAALSEQFRLTLVHLGEPRKDLDRRLFSQVRSVAFRGGELMLNEVLNNDFRLAYYPDVGMTKESIYLANLQLAPVQVTSYGHPVSTHGSRIDYFIGGAAVESVQDAQKNYSERLVLVPGMGVIPIQISHEHQKPEQQRSGHAIVNCPWSPMKINYPLLNTLREIVRRAERNVVFRLFPSSQLNRNNAYLPFIQDVRSILGAEHVEVVPPLVQLKYIQTMEQGDLSLDPYPFGGYNTIIDSLSLGKPIVTWRGEKFFNRAAAWLLKNVGLEELIAASWEEYVSKTVRLIDDQDYYRDLCCRMEGLDLRRTVFSIDSAAYFVKAIRFLMDDHERLQAEGSRDPILIQ